MCVSYTRAVLTPMPFVSGGFETAIKQYFPVLLNTKYYCTYWSLLDPWSLLDSTFFDYACYYKTNEKKCDSLKSQHPFKNLSLKTVTQRGKNGKKVVSLQFALPFKSAMDNVEIVSIFPSRSWYSYRNSFLYSSKNFSRKSPRLSPGITHLQWLLQINLKWFLQKCSHGFLQGYL